MCGIAGFCNYSEDFTEEAPFLGQLARRMGNTLRHRGPDENGVFVSNHAALAHQRLAVIDPEGGKQPMTAYSGGYRYTIVYNGELYNSKELRRELESVGHIFETTSDTEVLLKCYIHYGSECPKKLNGIFAFAIDDERRNRCFLCRDRFGVKPLFYTISGDRLVFGSEVKALLQYPGINPILDRQGLCEVLGIGPARTAGTGIFKDIYEIKPGFCGIYNRDGFTASPYFQLKSYEHPDSYEDTVKHVRYLVEDAVTRQLVSDVPLCTFLSGGLDSSIITSIAARKYRDAGQTLSTYSFEFTGNDQYFKPTAFQPDADDAWAAKMAQYCNTNHTVLKCDNLSQADKLYDAVDAKDAPGMADVDSSLLHFCRLIKKEHVVAVSGECADEIFGGYPWFHKQEALNGHCFPWSPDLSIRTDLFKPEINDALDLSGYVNQRYEESIAEVPKLEMENAQEARRREISYLNIRWFMSTLLNRKDRMSMASGLEVRVPYADHRILEYVFNVPWSYKCPDGVVKGLLRDAARPWLPEDVRMRRKSPYPKTHNPAYERILRRRLDLVMKDKEEPLHLLVNNTKIEQMLHEKSDYGKPWFGQLMAGPQMIAYLLQINYWLKTYEIEIEL
ncbi:MAG: asparagine synthase (glutamine-hydrolyzing) [Oscillospiraceae bacterium]|jgi:asparagine synthase (glutamine-hydrolysing)|nr:asparagine synthase (glutamine-hydrolyzing) [Oscillospiraceae bacterium]